MPALPPLPPPVAGAPPEPPLPPVFVALEPPFPPELELEPAAPPLVVEIGVTESSTAHPMTLPAPRTNNPIATLVSFRIRSSYSKLGCRELATDDAAVGAASAMLGSQM
jgi:hypothetical protein